MSMVKKSVININNSWTVESLYNSRLLILVLQNQSCPSEKVGGDRKRIFRKSTADRSRLPGSASSGGKIERRKQFDSIAVLFGNVFRFVDNINDIGDSSNIFFINFRRYFVVEPVESERREKVETFVGRRFRWSRIDKSRRRFAVNFNKCFGWELNAVDFCNFNFV